MSAVARARGTLRLSGPAFWCVALEATLTLVLARTLWTWRDDAYVYLPTAPYLPWLAAALTVSVPAGLLLLSRERAWARRAGWALTAARLCLLPLIWETWLPAMSPYVSLW